MSNWKDFEDETSNYLKNMLFDLDVEVEKFGEADSTTPDIEIRLNNNGKSFFVETKMPNSQTSQFVVEIINDRFIYGRKNHYPSNDFSDEILNELNQNFNYYKTVGQSGLILPIPASIAFGWIVSNMKNKNVEFIISIDSDNKEKIIPVEQFDEFFNVKTVLRRKKSGSAPLPKRYYEDFMYQISKKYKENEYSLYESENRLYIETTLNLLREDLYIESEIINDKKYYLSEKDKGIYEVKLTSSTNNPNVIFELSAKNINSDTFTIQSLIDYINQEENDN